MVGPICPSRRWGPPKKRIVPMKRLVTALMGSFALAASITGAKAQEYPTRPITVVVPYAPGGNTDVVARIVLDHMARTLGQQLVVENVGGAGGTTGSARAARGTPE